MSHPKSRADAAERHSTELLAQDWTAAHRLAADLNAYQRELLESALIAASIAGSAWALNRKGNAS